MTSDFSMKDGRPYSSRFQDIYFSGDGIAETDHVFIHSQNILERAAKADVFTILETGFGTGLNFLRTLQLFRKHAPECRLIYFSCELFPLQISEIELALLHLPELTPEIREFSAKYDPRLDGFQRFEFSGGQTLILLLGEARNLLPQIKAMHGGQRLDAIYLDGYAPARNPDMWNDDIYQQLARLSKSGTTLGTFTAAGEVRRGLAQAGFAVTKIEGSGSKKESLFGIMEKDPLHSGVQPGKAPWYNIAALPSNSQNVTIIGAGLCGCASARALAERGYSVRVFEAQGQSASKASGNLLGLAMPVLSQKPTVFSRLSLKASLSFNRKFSGMALGRGAIQLYYEERAGNRLRAALQNLRIHPEIAREVAALEIQTHSGFLPGCDGIFFPEAMAVSPAAVCQEYLNHSNIELITDQQLQSISRASGKTELIFQNGKSLLSDITVLATGSSDTLTSLADWLPVRPFQGQVLYLPESPASSKMKVSLCYSGYLTIAVNGKHVLGSIYEEGNSDTFRPEKNQEILAELVRMLPQFPVASAESYGGRAGVRMAAMDYTPVIGPLPDKNMFASDYDAISRTALHRIKNLPQSPAVWPGLYIITGVGSRGLLYSHIGAGLLAAQIAGEILPLEADLVDALSPVRFLYRKLRKNAGTIAP